MKDRHSICRLGKCLGLLVCLGLFGATPARAQERAGAKPAATPELLPNLRMPEKAEWTITFIKSRSKEGDKGSAAKNARADSTEMRPKQMTITKNGTTYREVTFWTNGARTEKWIVGDFQLLELPNAPILIRVAQGGVSFYKSDYSRSDFEGCEWIGLNEYYGTKKVQTLELYEFAAQPGKARLTPREQQELTRNSESDPGQSLAKMAYITVADRRPYFLDDGEQGYIYSYSSGPVETLVVPPKFDAEFKRWQAQIDKRKRKLIPRSPAVSSSPSL